MSSPLAIAGITLALKDLLNEGLLNHDLSSIGSFSVTAVPPDRITTGNNEPNQLNLFLYQVTPNLGWRNEDLPSRDASGRRVTNPPLALNLHYLLTAYGSQDLNAEVLLGYAMHLLHETPMLTRAQLRTALSPFPPGGVQLPPPFNNLSAEDLADQIELIKITPVYLSTEDLSKMWTAMQARYRPTMAYMASVVLIQSTGPVATAPPVLRRGALDRGNDAIASPAPVLHRLRPAASDLLPAMRLGDDLLLDGTNFVSPTGVTAVFEEPFLGVTTELIPVRVVSANRLELHLPSFAEDSTMLDAWAVGMYGVSLRIARPNVPAWTTNAVPIALAPQITVSPLNAAAGVVNLTVTCSPRLRPEQEARARLLFGSSEILPDSVTTPADPTQPSSLVFTVADVTAGEYVVRLRVGKIDSLPVVVSGNPATMQFDPQARVTVA